MRLKRLYVLAAALLFAGAARAEGVPEAIRTKGEMLAAADNPSVLCEYEEDAGALALFNRAVVRETAGKMAVQAAFAEAEEGGLLPGLSGGQYDLALGVNPPAGEEQGFLVTEPFAYSRTVLLVRGDNEAVTDFAGLSGARVAVTGAAEQLPEGLPQDVTAVPAETAEEALVGLALYRADKALCYGTNTQRERMQPLRLQKRGVIQCKFAPMNLVAGTYWFDVGLRRMDMFAYDYAAQAVRFTVYDPIDETGVTRLDHTWEIR